MRVCDIKKLEKKLPDIREMTIMWFGDIVELDIDCLVVRGEDHRHLCDYLEGMAAVVIAGNYPHAAFYAGFCMYAPVPIIFYLPGGKATEELATMANATVVDDAEALTEALNEIKDDKDENSDNRP